MPLEWAHVPRRLDRQDAGPRRSPVQAPQCRRPDGAATDSPAGRRPAWKIVLAARQTTPQPHTHDGYECRYVLSGRTRLVLGDRNSGARRGGGRAARHPAAPRVRQHRSGPRRGAEHLRPSRRTDARPRPLPSTGTGRVRPTPPEAAAPRPLLQTKLYAPRADRGLVDRPRLSRLLRDRSAGHRPSLMLVSAPAASASRRCWRSRCSVGAIGAVAHVAWLSLDAGDNDPVDLLDLRARGPPYGGAGLGGSAQVLLESPGGAADRHGADQPAQRPRRRRRRGRAGPRRLPRHPRARDPRGDDVPGRPPAAPAAPRHRDAVGPAAAPGPAARPRRARRGARRRPAVHRARRPRRTSTSMGLHLSADEVTTLEGRTEGWVAALQLAALSLQGREDAAGFIDGFAGDDRHVVDYLVEEVVHRQPDDVQTSCCGPPCSPGCPDPWPTPSRAGPTAGRCSRCSTATTSSWCRSTTSAGGTATTTSSPTCCRPGSSTSSPARRPSCTAGPARGTSRTATPARPSSTPWRPATRTGLRDLVELVMPALRQGPPRSQLRRWLEALPDEVFAAPSRAGERVRRRADVHRRDPRGRVPAAHRRAVGRAGTGGRRRRRSRRRRGRRPGRVAPAPRLGQDPPRRAGPDARRRGRHAWTTRRARDRRARADDDLGHGAATALAGARRLAPGDLATAEAAYAESIRRFERVGYVADILGCAVTLADLQLAQGRLRDAERTFRDALDLAERQPAGPCAARRTCTSG